MHFCFANKIIGADQLSGVSKLEISGFDSVEIINSNKLSIEILGSEHDLLNIEQKTNKKSFKIQYSNHQKKHERLNIKLYVPENYHLDFELINNGSFTIVPNMIFKDFNLYAMSVGVINISSKFEHLTLNGKSIGSIKMVGQSLRSDFTLINSSKIDCSEFVINELNLDCTNVSEAILNVLDKISGHVTNCSKVVIIGQPGFKDILNRNSREIIYK